MKRLEMYAHKSNGTVAIERVERDDPIGRREMDKAAFVRLDEGGVVTVSVVRTVRSAGGQKGSYR